MTKHSPESDAARHLPLDEKVGRVAETLATRALDKGVDERPSSADERASLAEAVDWVVRARRQRARYMPMDLFGDPVWDMLLNLFHADLMHRRLSASALARACAFSESNGRRWLEAMANQGLIARTADSDHGEDELIVLEPQIASALRRYFREVVQSR